MTTTRTLDTTFNARLRHLRTEHGYTQSDMAHRAGIHVKTYERYERGNCEPSLSILRDIAAAFGISIAALMEGVK